MFVHSPFLAQQQFLDNNTQYRGRFAPSPSGPLHFGSLVAALGSYLQAKSNNGLWFVRIEDIDKPREQDGARERILEGLNAFGLNWDIDQNTVEPKHANYQHCLVQSERIERYQQVLDYLIEQNLVYACQCTRKQIKASGGIYQGTCSHKHLDFAHQAIRIHLSDATLAFQDVHFGDVNSPANFATEDFIIKRRDQLFAYQLVVVVDDIDQGINQVVRGADILELTTRQLSLYKLFDVSPPSYLHLPLAVTKPGFKLSKQNHAVAINIKEPKTELLQALTFLGLPVEASPDLGSGTIEQILQWAITHWNVSNLGRKTEIII